MESDTISQFDIALGASIGQKWVNKMGWTFEINFGVGRFITNNQTDDYNGYYSRPEATLKGSFNWKKVLVQQIFLEFSFQPAWDLYLTKKIFKSA